MKMKCYIKVLHFVFFWKVDHAVLDLISADGSNSRKLGMVGVLSNTPELYKPGAFGGATIEDPWECMER